MSFQEGIALLIVGVAAGFIFRKFYLQYLALPLSNFFLRKGKVALAMRVRASAKKSGCSDDCSCD